MITRLHSHPGPLCRFLFSCSMPSSPPISPLFASFAHPHRLCLRLLFLTPSPAIFPLPSPPPPPPPLVRLRYRHGNLILSGRPPSSSAYLCTTREKSWGGIRCSSPPELPWFAGGCHLERYSYRALIRRRVENFKHDRRSC